MQQSLFSFKELLTQIVGEMARAMAVRDGEPIARRQARTQVAVSMIMAFLPRDVIEAVLAGRCIMFQELMVDGVRRTLTGEADTQRRATRANIVALDRCFTNNLKLLEQHKNRPSEGELDAEPDSDRQAEAEAGADAPAIQEPPAPSVPDQPAVPAAADGQSETATADGQPEPATPELLAHPDLSPASTPEFKPATAAMPPDPTEADVPMADAAAPLPIFAREKSFAECLPSRGAVDAVLSNPAAMAAMEAGDAAAFARALGVEPCEEFLAAASMPGGPFDPAAWNGIRDEAWLDDAVSTVQPMADAEIHAAGD